MSIRLRKRHRLRKKEIKALSDSLKNTFSQPYLSDDQTIDRADAGKFDVIFVNGDIIGLIYKDKPFLSVKGLLKFSPQNRFVTVDMGAVKFVYNGADVMAPGIVDADLDIAVGDLVWIRDEKNLKSLAVGEALMSGKVMIESDSGKAVHSIHHVGDDIWNYEIS
jgi:PUA domain protein